MFRKDYARRRARAQHTSNKRIHTRICGYYSLPRKENTKPHLLLNPAVVCAPDVGRTATIPKYDTKKIVPHHLRVHVRVVKKTRFWGNRLLFDFLNFYVEEKTVAKSVTCTMIFNTVSTMTNLSLISQNLLFSCLGIGLLTGFLVFHPIKISFV